MVEIIVSGHNQFADGLVSAMTLIAGTQEQVHSVNFLEEYSTDDLKQHMEDEMKNMGSRILILTDLQGGSPYNVSVVIKSEHSDKEIEVLSGTNLALLLACVFAGETDAPLAEVAEDAVAQAKDGMGYFKLARKEALAEDEEDGI